MTNLATNLKDAAGQFPEKAALREGERVLTYAELDDLTARVAGRLREAGVEPGDRIGVMLPNVLAFPVAYYGALRAGATVVPMNPLFKSREVEHYVTDSGAKVLFAWHEVVDSARDGAEKHGVEVIAVDEDILSLIGGWTAAPEYAPRDDGDTAVILYTSGTTGSPKGAELTHSNLRSNASVSATTLFNMSPDDVIMGCLPMFHTFGQTCAMNTTIVTGGTLVLLPRFDPTAALEIIEREKITVFAGVPTMYVALLGVGGGKHDTGSLRLCISGGAALPGEVLKSFQEVFGAQILEGYGLSETSPVASFNRVGANRVGSIGTPVDGVEMKVVDTEDNEVGVDEVGEIAIRGENVMRGYWNRPEATAESMRGGWFHTGDMARKDADGFFYIVDRMKDLIIRGGYNVYPREIEEVLYEHEDIVEAAVIGLPHPSHGEEVGAAIALREGSTATVEEIRAYVKERVAAYKYPRVVWLVEALPKGATGKILKREIVAPEEV